MSKCIFQCFVSGGTTVFQRGKKPGGVARFTCQWNGAKLIHPGCGRVFWGDAARELAGSPVPLCSDLFHINFDKFAAKWENNRTAVHLYIYIYIYVCITAPGIWILLCYIFGGCFIRMTCPSKFGRSVMIPRHLKARPRMETRLWARTLSQFLTLEVLVWCLIWMCSLEKFWHVPTQIDYCFNGPVMMLMTLMWGSISTREFAQSWHRWFPSFATTKCVACHHATTKLDLGPFAKVETQIIGEM